jgi:tetratricopeptide (TPR) repeat protein
MVVSRGNPGLQDLIGLRIVYSDQVPMQRAEQAVAGMEAYLHQGDLPSDAEVQAFLENLALDSLLEEAGPPNVALLRAATLFNLPVPESVIQVLAEQLGGSLDRLRGLGLLDPYSDLYDTGRVALAVNPLAAGRLEPLSTDEQAGLAKVTVASLFTAWGGPAAQSRWARELDLQLTVLALLGDDPTVVAASAADAVQLLRSGPAADALQLGKEAIALLDRHQQAMPLNLLRTAADAAFSSGDGDTGDTLLDRAMRQVETGDQEEVDPLEQARVIADRGRRHIVRGDWDQAEQLLQHAHQLLTDAGSEDEAATAMGEIATIAFMRGDYDEAERIRREVELPVYERLGQTRSVAVIWGRIADIAYERGDYEEAERIRREVVLPVYERLGDTRSTGVTWGRIARIAYERGHYDEAAELQRKRLEIMTQLGDLAWIAETYWDLARIDLAQNNYESALHGLLESFQILQQLRRADGIAVVGVTLGELLLATGQAEEARQVLGESLAAATKIGGAELAKEINKLLNQLGDEENEKT